MPNTFRKSHGGREQYFPTSRKKHSFIKQPSGRKFAVRDFPHDNAIVKTTKHLTVISGGVHFDTWDSGRSKANTYYTPPPLSI